jgi:hypothetical protein
VNGMSANEVVVLDSVSQVPGVSIRLNFLPCLPVPRRRRRTIIETSLDTDGTRIHGGDKLEVAEPIQRVPGIRVFVRLVPE